MIQYIIAGLVLGGIYAIAASGLVVTYVSAGILNLSFGALAYFIARCFYWLHTQHQLGVAPAAAISLLVVAPVLGAALYVVLFRPLQLATTLIKIVATLGLAVCIPPIATLLFGNVTILKAAGLAPEPVAVYHVLAVPVTLDQVIVYGCVVGVVTLGLVVLRYTDIGLRVRAMVDSPAMTSLSGTSPRSTATGVWAVSVMLAGLAGILSAPIIGLDPNDYTLLMAAAFAAVVAAKLRSIPVAVAVGLLLGVVGALVQEFLPPSSSFTAAVIPSIPFAVTSLFLCYHMLRVGRVDEEEGVGGALDRAISPSSGPLTSSYRMKAAGGRPLRWRGASFGVAAIVAVSLVLRSFWVGLLAAGVAYAVIFLALTLVVGEGGMIWACEVTFAGIGAISAAQLATVFGWPVPVAMLVGPLAAVPIGVAIGFLTIRLGPLYVTVVTLMFGLLMDNLVFSRDRFAQQGLGVALRHPDHVTSDRALLYFGLAVFCVVSLFIVNVRRSTTGLALSAVRSSQIGARAIGLSVLQIKVLIAGVAAFIAGVGGALLAMNQGSALPGNYATLAGIVWLAVLVTAGIRSNLAALAAGLLFTVLPALVVTHLPKSFGQVPPILFGLGAIMVAKNPEGWMVQQASQLAALWARTDRHLRRYRQQSPTLVPVGVEEESPAFRGSDVGPAAHSGRRTR